MIIAEVVETKMALKPNQKDKQGNPLPLGSIEVRIAGRNSGLDQVRNVYARPANWNGSKLPLIGEQVMVMLAPVNSSVTDAVGTLDLVYFIPINATDDLVLHQFPLDWTRDQDGQLPFPGKRLADQRIPGYTFPKKPKRTDPLQPFEGDTIYEGRFGQTIRFGTTVMGNLSVYSKKPTWQAAANTDPLIILKVIKPSLPPNNDPEEFKAKYSIEDLSKDDASVYICTTQMLPKFKAGFKKNLDVKLAPTWKGKSQIVVDAERVIINARKDKAFLVGSKEAVVTGKAVLFQDENYKVYLSDLMDFLKSWLDQDSDLATAKAQYSTACGPTAISTNMAQFIKLATVDWTKFKLP